MKQLSIIIPAYNVSNYIEECLDSLVQDDSFLEYLDIIVVNDGSTDDTLSKREIYEKKYPNCLRVIDKENGGHGSGINCGLQQATGKYVKVLDADDWVVTTSLKKLVQCIADLSDCPDIIINSYEQIWKKEGRVVTHSLDKIPVKTLNSLDCLNTFGYRYTIHSLTIKTEIYKNCVTQKIDEKTSYDDVQYVLYPVPYIQSFLYLEDVLYQYRMGESSQSVSVSNMLKNRNKLKGILCNAWTYYSSEKEHMNTVQQEYYLRDMGYSVGDYFNLLFTVEDVNMAKEEFMDFVKTIPFPTKYIVNKKARVVIYLKGIMFKWVSIWYRKSIK